MKNLATPPDRTTLLPPSGSGRIERIVRVHQLNRIMICLTRRFGSLWFLVLMLGFATGAVAQQTTTWDARQVQVSRAELDSLLAQYDQAASAGAYSSDLRDQARREANLIRTRLAEGDFQPGDQIAVSVEGEEKLSGGYVVQPGPTLSLPDIGGISLRGVLRSELEDHLKTELQRFIRSPTVQTRSSVRLMITGSVGKAGYHVLATNTVFPDALLVAGGPSGNAALENIRVERAGRVIWAGGALQQAIIEGRTLDQLSMRAGDHIIVPANTPSRSFSRSVRRVATTVGPFLLLTRLLMRIF